jgi:formylmethanofuran:tetrahydromethanopterin formyltransferase
LAALGGYFFPSFSTCGEQEHHSPSGTESITEGMWLPQPHQVTLSVEISNRVRQGVLLAHTAGRALSLHTHDGQLELMDILEAWEDRVDKTDFDVGRERRAGTGFIYFSTAQGS